MNPLPDHFTVSDYLIQRLHEAGLRDVFTVPGDYVARWFDYIDDPARNPDTPLTRLGCRSELEAGYAADAYTRLRGIGCAAVTYGVGAFSLVNPVAGSYVERLPVVAISGSPGTASTDRPFARTYKILLHHATSNYRADRDAYQHITVAAEIIRDAAHAPAEIDRALGLALAYKRPVYLELWRNLWDAECARPQGALAVPKLPRDQTSVTQAAAAAAARITAAAKPLFWAGVELQRYGLQDAFRDLRDQTGLPYITSLLAKSVLAETAEGFVGTYTGPSSDYTTYQTVANADLLVVTGDLITDDYEGIVQADFTTMIVAYDNAVRIGAATYSDVPLADFLAALGQAMKDQPARQPWATKGPATIDPDYKPFPPDLVTYARFFKRMETWVDADMTLVPDESSSMYVSCNIPVNRANGFVSQAAWGAIGYASAAGFGLSVADPAARPVVFAGDGGFQMVAQTISSMAHYGRNPVVFIMENAIYGIEQALTNSATYTEDQPFNAYNKIPKWEYAEFARALGAKAARVATLEHLEAVLAEVKEDRGHVWLVQVVLPERDIPSEILRLATNTPPSPGQ
ncbi:thiamine pyrophosphate-binding protein [Nitrospirillum sp. BR 11164]|uniref:alpha-keto acid decarboxylase family protein n=1 Tax=Nitrospirillum sp. BR 11164 TaxID=3104324 RepID=UPI002AFF7561|nr:thiamine pyrophosphate-binding protein [Nitrospirillum sp. BR 11164]MEA1652112.1 thiamine pyrophosphate-binding protein [Nitrospirillum sp. BR 11164]